MVQNFQHRFTSIRLAWRLTLLAVLGVTAAALTLGSTLPASAQTPQLVTNPDGGLSYVTAANGSAIVATGGGASYVNGGGNPMLITNPNGSVSYASVNGGPSLVAGPNGTLNYQNVIVGSNGTQAVVGYSTPNGPSSAAVTVNSGATNAGTTQSYQAPAPNRVDTSGSTGGRYCDLPDGGGQEWVAFGAPAGLAICQ